MASAKEEKKHVNPELLPVAAQIAAGLLAGTNVSHRNPSDVARIAVAQAKALISEAENS